MREILTSNFISSLLTCLPLIMIGFFKRKNFLSAGILALLLFNLDGLCATLPLAFGAQGLTWAVGGKLLQISVFGVLAWRLDVFSFSRPNSATWVLWSLGLGLLTLLPGLPNELYEEAAIPSPAWGLYQATLPGIAEELIYRGVILAILDKLLGRPTEFVGIAFGWGAVVTTFQFYFAHCLQYDVEVVVQWTPLLDFLIFGGVMCWLRYRFESVWPAILAHNTHNVLLPYVVKAAQAFVL